MGYLGTKPANSPLTSELIPDGIITTSDIASLAVTPEKMSQKLTMGTAVASTSGTSIDFTGIPSWVKRITVMFDSVSISGTSGILVQLGDSGGIETTGYLSTAIDVSTSGTGSLTSTAGMAVRTFSASFGIIGSMTISNISGNIWISSGTVGRTTQDSNQMLAGNKTLSATLDRIRITTVNGTDTFDAGSINIMYEG